MKGKLVVTENVVVMDIAAKMREDGAVVDLHHFGQV